MLRALGIPQFDPAQWMRCSTPLPRGQGKLSTTTIWPSERVGSRHFSTHSSDRAASIGRSSAFDAVSPRRRETGDAGDPLVVARAGPSFGCPCAPAQDPQIKRGRDAQRTIS